MSDSVRVYVSAGPELEPEREAIGRALAEFPINLGWEIKRTPRIGERTGVESAGHCDAFVLLFASDIRAPVGWERMIAKQTGRFCLAFLRRGALQTPAGRQFVRELKTEWRPFDTGQDLARQLMEALSVHVLEHWQRFRLSAQEWERLSSFVARLRGEEIVEGPEAEPAGAGEGGVILAPGRNVPRGGVVVDG
jgi:hypothetical protein